MNQPNDPTVALLQQIAQLKFSITGVETDGAQRYYMFKSRELLALKPLIEAHVAEQVQAADHIAMLREATHRANDASDRLLRIDREACIAWHAQCLAELKKGNPNV